MGNRMFWHVMNRGVRKAPIFMNDRQRQWFLNLLEKGMLKYEVEMAAFSLMDNHYHLEPFCGRKELSSLLLYVNSRFARRFNREAGLSGHLFEGPTKAYPARWIGWEGKVSRYIHMNPVKGGLVRHPGDFKWSSMGHYQGRPQNTLPVNTRLLQARFGEGNEGANGYRAYMEEGIRMFREENQGKPTNLLLPEEIDVAFERHLIGAFQENLSEEVRARFSFSPSSREFRLLVTLILLDSGMVSKKMLASGFAVSERTLREYRTEAREKGMLNDTFGEIYRHFMDQLDVVGWRAYGKKTA